MELWNRFLTPSMYLWTLLANKEKLLSSKGLNGIWWAWTKSSLIGTIPKVQFSRESNSQIWIAERRGEDSGNRALLALSNESWRGRIQKWVTGQALINFCGPLITLHRASSSAELNIHLTRLSSPAEVNRSLIDWQASIAIGHWGLLVWLTSLITIAAACNARSPPMKNAETMFSLPLWWYFLGVRGPPARPQSSGSSRETREITEFTWSEEEILLKGHQLPLV